MNLLTAAVDRLKHIGQNVAANATADVQQEFSGVVDGLAQHVTEVAHDVAQGIADTATQQVARTAQRIADDPAVNKALNQIGKTVAKPAKQQLTPIIVGAAAGVLLLIAITVYLVRQR